MGMTTKVYRASLFGDENVLKLTVVMVVHTYL